MCLHQSPFLMGIPWSEAVPAGSLMATKLITNEFVAMLDFKNVLGDVSARTQGIISVYLVSFANFGTVGIIVGSIKGISDKQGEKVASFAMRLLLGSTCSFNHFRINHWLSIVNESKYLN